MNRRLKSIKKVFFKNRKNKKISFNMKQWKSTCFLFLDQFLSEPDPKVMTNMNKFLKKKTNVVSKNQVFEILFGDESDRHIIIMKDLNKLDYLSVKPWDWILAVGNYLVVGIPKVLRYEIHQSYTEKDYRDHLETFEAIKNNQDVQIEFQKLLKKGNKECVSDDVLDFFVFWIYSLYRPEVIVPTIATIQYEFLRDNVKPLGKNNPLILHNGHYHWFCMMMTFNDEIWIMDSKRKVEDSELRHVTIKRNSRSELYAKLAYLFLEPTETSRVVPIRYIPVPQQPGGYECGYFSMAILIHLLQFEVVPTQYQTINIHSVRQWLREAFVRNFSEIPPITMAFS
jgi:hypothetical protein